MTRRTNMLASVIRELISPVLPACPAECGVVTITKVEVSADYGYATVYISALKQPELALEYLQEHRGQLQRRLGALERARIPKLRFRHDEASQQGQRIEDLLRKEQAEQ